MVVTEKRLVLPKFTRGIRPISLCDYRSLKEEILERIGSSLCSVSLRRGRLVTTAVSEFGDPYRALDEVIDWLMERSGKIYLTKVDLREIPWKSGTYETPEETPWIICSPVRKGKIVCPDADVIFLPNY